MRSLCAATRESPHSQQLEQNPHTASRTQPSHIKENKKIVIKTFHDISICPMLVCITHYNAFYALAILNYFQLPKHIIFLYQTDGCSFQNIILHSYCAPHHPNLPVKFGSHLQLPAHFSFPLLTLCPLCCAFWGLYCGICHMKS